MSHTLWLLVVGLAAGCITVQPVPTDALERAADRHAAAKAREVPVPSYSFRSNEPDGAMSRAQDAVAARCGSAERDGNLVRSQWFRTTEHDDLTRVFERCVVSVTPEPSDGSVEVRVVFEQANCPRLKLVEGGIQKSGIGPDEVAAKCRMRTSVSPEAAVSMRIVADHLQEDIFRR